MYFSEIPSATGPPWPPVAPRLVTCCFGCFFAVALALLRNPVGDWPPVAPRGPPWPPVLALALALALALPRTLCGLKISCLGSMLRCHCFLRNKKSRLSLEKAISYWIGGGCSNNNDSNNNANNMKNNDNNNNNDNDKIIIK